MIKIDKYTPGQILLFFLLLSVLLRLGSFFYSVIDHDESTYLIIADEMLKGKKLYKEVIDNKPPGIFLVFSLVQLIFGKSIVGLRLFGALILGISAFLIYRIRLHFSGKKSLAVWSGMLYIFLFTLYRTGMAINTELFFNCMTVLALYVMLPQKKSSQTMLARMAAMGLIMGCGFIIKYVIITDFMALILLFVLLQCENGTPIISIKNTKSIALAAVAFALPFAGVNLYFYLSGNFQEYAHITYEVVSNYPSSSSLGDVGMFFLNFHLKYVPFPLLFYWAMLIFYRKEKKSFFLFGLVWYFLDWSIMLYIGKNFHHYYFQLLPVLVLFIPEIAYAKIFQRSMWKQNSTVWQLSIVVVLFAIVLINQSYFWKRDDMPRIIAAELKEEVRIEDQIWTLHRMQIIPYLLDLSPASPYIHPTILIEHSDAFMINKFEEIENILAREPKFVLFKDVYPFVNSIDQFERNYSLKKHYGNIQLWESNKFTSPN